MREREKKRESWAYELGSSFLNSGLRIRLMGRLSNIWALNGNGLVRASPSLSSAHVLVPPTGFSELSADNLVSVVLDWVPLAVDKSYRSSGGARCNSPLDY